VPDGGHASPRFACRSFAHPTDYDLISVAKHRGRRYRYIHKNIAWCISVSAPSSIQLKPHGGSGTPFFAKRPEPLVNVDPKGNRRAKIWDISPALHCSIIGTCLTAGELRQFLAKFEDMDAGTATDHALHSRGVRAAGQHDAAGKLLHKLLDNRHDNAIKRFSKASTSAEVRDMWLQAFEQGGIPGAYWAVLTHPATDRPLVEEVFGQVHMLSHMVGSSNRIDITRLRDLERQLGERDAKIARQESRLSASASERSEMLQRIEALEGELRRRTVADNMAADAGNGGDAAAALLQRVDAEKAHAARLAARVIHLEEQLQGARKFAATLQKQNSQLENEIAVLESSLRIDDVQPGTSDLVESDLQGVTLLYVGGRPGLIDQLKAQCAKRGGVLLAHDGGIEDNSAVLPGLISRANAAFFPVDCVSHRAAGQVKKLCRDIGKPFVPLRSASVASFLAAINAADIRQNAER
jgi:hypothetical protein